MTTGKGERVKKSRDSDGISSERRKRKRKRGRLGGIEEEEKKRGQPSSIEALCSCFLLSLFLSLFPRVCSPSGQQRCRKKNKGATYAMVAVEVETVFFSLFASLVLLLKKQKKAKRKKRQDESGESLDDDEKNSLFFFFDDVKRILQLRWRQSRPSSPPSRPSARRERPQRR